MSVIKTAVIQADLVWQNAAANRDFFAGTIENLPAVDLIVLPEMFTTGFSMDSAAIAEAETGETLTWLKQQAKAANAAVTGSVAVRTAANNYVNRMWFVTQEQQVFFYDKKHLFRIAGEHQAYQAGTERVIVNWRGMRFCLQVCYDIRFPVFSRNREDYDALIYVANWPAARRQPWITLLQARAIENQAFVIGCNRTGTDGNNLKYSGDSLIVNYLGQPVAELDPDQNGVLYAELDLAALQRFKQKFPAYLDADQFTLDT